MYSAGEEFEKTNSEGDVEEYTCLSNITVGDKEYLVCDSETGEKKVFYYDSIESSGQGNPAQERNKGYSNRKREVP